MRRDRDRELGALIREKIKIFWRMVESGIEPQPDYVKDGDVIKLIYADVSGSDVDLSNNNRANALIGEYAQFQKAESEAKKAKEAAKAEMITLMGNASMARIGDAYVTRKLVSKKAYSVAESSYLDFRIKQAKGDTK